MIVSLQVEHVPKAKTDSFIAFALFTIPVRLAKYQITTLARKIPVMAMGNAI